MMRDKHGMGTVTWGGQRNYIANTSVRNHSTSNTGVSENGVTEDNIRRTGLVMWELQPNL